MLLLFRSFFMVPQEGVEPSPDLTDEILSFARMNHFATAALVLLVLRKRVELLIQRLGLRV